MKDSTTSSEGAPLERARGRIGKWRPAQVKRCVGRSGLAQRCAAWSKAGLWLVGLSAGLAWAPAASAQGKVVTIAEVTIVGRIQKPIAAVDVSRIQPQMTLAELRQPFLDRIEKAVYRAPF